MILLSAVLSRMGYEKVVGIVESDEFLKKQSASGAPPFGRDELQKHYLLEFGVSPPSPLSE